MLWKISCLRFRGILCFFFRYLATDCILLFAFFYICKERNWCILKKEATIYDIAKALNLSASTVSRALNNNPVINPETRKKVNECAKKMGYQSNTFASSLRTRRTNTIGVIVPKLDSNFMSTCLAGMEEVATENGYNMIISQSHESVKRETENADHMFIKRVDGLIASLTKEDNVATHFNRFNDKKVPVVFFDRVPDCSQNACFVLDNYNAAYVATMHLIEQGCRNLCHLTIDSLSNVYIDRIRGFNAAVAECEGCKGTVVYLDALNLDAGKAIIPSVLNDDKCPDGIFVANDMTAVGCIIALQESGKKVPDDIAVVGFNDDPVATIIKPELTTISYPGKEAGILAAQTLIAHLLGNSDIYKTNRVVLKSQLIIRGSSLKRK